MRRRYAVVLAAVAAVALAGCGGLSTSSSIRPGLEVGEEPLNEVRVEANPVAPGSTPEQVVSGFIHAAAASDDQYLVARSYLAAQTAASWRPDTSVVIFAADTPAAGRPGRPNRVDRGAPADSAVDIAVKGPDTVTAVVDATARIDGDGRYHELPANSRVSVSFGMGRVDGQWRITRLPEGFGIWLSGSDVDRLYEPYRIYFLSTTERRLVPDVRWFPLGSGLATRLARALLAGAPSYLAGAVRTDVPAGTRLAVDAVTIDSGMARVDLTAARLGSDPARRQNLGAQFFATVSQAPGVERVTLRLEGADLQMPGGDTTLDSLGALGFGTPADPQTRPVLRTGNSLAPVLPEQLGEPQRNRAGKQPGASLPSLQPGWAYLALAANGQEVAAVSGDRRQLARWRGTEQVQLAQPGYQLTRPTYDTEGALWFAGKQGSTTRLWVVNSVVQPTDAAARPFVVAARWLAGRTVVSQRLSPDGQRIAVVSTNPSGGDPKLQVAGVVREPDGIPKALAEPLELAPSLSLIRDSVWVDEATVAVLGRQSSSQVIRPWFVPLGGPITAGPDLAGGTSISTVNGERGLVVTTDRQQVMLRAGNRWQRVGQATDFAAPAR